MLVARKNDAIPLTSIGQLLERMEDARHRSDELFAIVREDSLYERPIPERHRIIFYLGHLEAFDWNLLNGNVFELRNNRAGLDRLFAFGIDPVGGGLPTDVPSDWPSEAVVRSYVNDVRRELDLQLARDAGNPEAKTHDGLSILTLLNVVVEHRLMHVETLAYMLHQLSLDKKVLLPKKPIIVDRPIEHAMVAIPAGAVTLGLSHDSREFGWDNEFEAHTVNVSAFEIDLYKVTSQQYLGFMVAGGYEDSSLWREDDWKWKEESGISHPLFWRHDGKQWFFRTMFDEVPLPLAWPVYVSQAEASAYARWAGKSLPTEAEWQHAVYGSSDGIAGQYPRSNADSPDVCFGNFDFHGWDPTPVNAYTKNQSAFGVTGALGNGWEWTSTAFAPFPGFESFPFYRGYSADFFDGKHFVMKGGSARTASCMLRPSFRNWFQPHYQNVYSGFRCVRR